MMTRRQEWVFRLRHEVYNDTEKAFFITLTYDDEHLDLNKESYLPEVSVRTCQLFLKSLRKQVPNFRYFLCSEYGSHFTIRPHYHIILMFPKNDNTNYYDEEGNLKMYPRIKDVSLLDFKTMQAIVSDTWFRGFVQVAPVTPARIAYVTKYCLKYQNVEDNRTPGFTLMSRRPGIGSTYFTDSRREYYQRQLLDHQMMLTQGEDGKQISLPRYYANKLDRPEDQALINETLARVRFFRKMNVLKSKGMELNNAVAVMKEREKRYKRKLK